MFTVHIISIKDVWEDELAKCHHPHTTVSPPIRHTHTCTCNLVYQIPNPLAFQCTVYMHNNVKLEQPGDRTNVIKVMLTLPTSCLM